MYHVVHRFDDCAHYNDRPDRDQELEAGARELALIHNWFCHGVKSARGPCATYVPTDKPGTAEEATGGALTEASIHA